MSVTFRCERCSRSYSAADSYAGRKVRCRACGQVGRIPEAAMPAQPSGYALAPESNAVPPAATRPSRPPKPQPPKSESWWELLRSSALDAGHLQGVSVCLIGLSVADLLVTHALLRSGGMFYESNPVANWVFTRWNIAGMTAFKFAVIGGVIALGEIIERRRPGWGRAVLLIGCVAAGAVVIHGLRLLLAHQG